MNLGLQNFLPSEFREWYDQMSPRLLILLDSFRHQCGSIVSVSGSSQALGRKLGKQSTSAHNVDYWGDCLAVDVFIDGVYLRAQVSGVVELAKRVGFTGIGVYADTSNNKGQAQAMFHLDVRPDRSMGSPATWGRVSGKYTTLDNAIQHCPAKMGV